MLNYEYQQILLARVKRADTRGSIIATINDFLKIQKSNKEPSEFYRLIQIAFIDKIQPSLFGHITEKEFGELFGLLFIGNPFPGDSLCTLIQSINSISKDNQFKFTKLRELIGNCQTQLLLRLLLISQNDTPIPTSSVSNEHLSFILASLPSRLCNFLGNANGTAAAIASFEDRLLASLLEAMEQDGKNGELNVELMAHILNNYNEISSEFTHRFLRITTANEQYEEKLKKIFSFNQIDRRKRENILLTLIQFAPDGDSLKKFFGNSISSDQLLWKCMTSKAIFLSSSLMNLRNSKKAAQYFSMIGQKELTTSFMELLQLFADQCRLIDMVTLHNQFQLSVAILDFARQFSTEMFEKNREEVTNLLVPVFTQILQQPELSRRQIGMFLAETLFTMFQCPSPPKFDYQKDDPIYRELTSIFTEDEMKDEDGEKTKKEFTNQADKGAKTLERIRPSQKADSRVAILDSDDDDEEMIQEDEINHAIEERLNESAGRSQPQHTKPFAYIRDCIDTLRSEKEDPERWEAALNELPGMVQRRALGLDVLAVELLETALFLEDRFKTPNFKATRGSVLKLIIAYRPELVSHLARLYTSKICSMAHRFSMLIAIVQAAKLLSGHNEKSVDVAEGWEAGPMVKEVAIADEKEIQQEDDPKTEEDANQNKNGPKIVWRSSATSKPMPAVWKDKFAVVAPQFAFPLLNLCSNTNFQDIDFVLFGRTIISLAEVIKCSKNSPSIVRISSATLCWLKLVCSRQKASAENAFVLSNYLGLYIAIIDTMDSHQLREHFSEELRALWIWLSEIVEGKWADNVEANEAVRYSIHTLSFKLNEIFAQEKIKN